MTTSQQKDIPLNRSRHYKKLSIQDVDEIMGRNRELFRVLQIKNCAQEVKEERQSKIIYTGQFGVR